MRSAELARTVAVGSERLDQLAVGRPLGDAANAVRRILIEELRVVRFGDENAAVRSDQHVVGLGQLRGRIAGLTAGADRHQQLALRAELQHGVALALGIGKLRQLLRRRRARVRDPDVALLVDVHAVRPQDLSRAEARHDLAGGIELDHRIDLRIQADVAAAAIAGPDVFAVSVDVHRADRAPFPAVRQRAEVADRFVWIGQVVDRLDRGVFGRSRRSARRPCGRLGRWRRRLRQQQSEW